MKKICLTVLMSMFLLTSCKNENEEKMLEKIDRIESYVVRNSLAEPGYKIYPTQNMWNFLKLDTRTGKINIVQFSVEGDNKRFEYVLSDVSRAENEIPGRFILQPTQNMYNFIMLDQLSGQTYQVQWSFDEDKRFVLPIN